MQLSVKISGNGIGQIQNRLRGVVSRQRAVATAGEVALKAGIKADALAAVDRHGARMRPRKHPRSDGANGPVVSPHHSRSRRIANFVTKFVNRAAGWEISAGWIGDVGFFHHLAKRGRDVRGPSPNARHKTVEAVREEFLGGFRR
jgi:hypothetical protein